MAISSQGSSTGPDTTGDIAAVYDAVRAEVVGRDEQIASVLAVVAAGRDLLLEGPPGTSKSTILRAVTRHFGIPLVFVEGSAELTPAKLIGYHNPADVVRHGYRAEDFVDGPLPRAMREGGFLYLEEFNRIPEDTLNALLTAMAERELTIPRVGRLAAAPSFRLVAAMNPFDNVGTTRVSQSIYDRLCRMAIGYQTEAEEREIVALRTGCTSGPLVSCAVAITRATRERENLRVGSSVRGAIDLVLVAEQLAQMRGLDVDGGPVASGLLQDAACLALSSKVAVDEACGQSPEHVLSGIVAEL
jgi:MoxR-like ATPase